MKCSACENNECEGKYEHRNKCVGEKEGIECTCICRITHNEAVLSSALSIGTGVAVTAAGIGLTVVTGGMAAIIAGAAIAGSGTSLVFSPLQKYMLNECVTLKESAKEVAIGATIGAVTGPIGAIGSIASRGASAAVQIGARIVAGSSAGAVTGVLSEGAKAMQGEEVTFKSVAHSAAIGAAVGTIGGASSQIARGVTKPITNEIGKAVTRIAVQGSSTAVTDAGVQLLQNGTVNPQQLILNTTGKMTLATTAEVSTSVTKQIEGKITDSHNKKHVILTKADKGHSDNARLKEDQATDKHKPELEKLDSNLQANANSQKVNPMKQQQQEFKLDQDQNTKPEASETFDQRLMGVVNSTGMAFNGMLSNFSSQLKSSYDHFTGFKNPLQHHDVKDEERDKEEIKMKEILSKESDDTQHDTDEDIREQKPDIRNFNESPDLPETDSSLPYQNDHLDTSNPKENMASDISDESVPLLIKIDYDLLLEAQDSDSDQLDQIQSIKSGDNEKSTETSNNIKTETLKSSLKPILTPSTSKNAQKLPHGSDGNEMDQGLEQLSSLVLKVIASMEVEATPGKELPDQSLSTNNTDSHTCNENSDDKEVIDASYDIIQASSTYELIDQKTIENDEINDVTDETYTEEVQNTLRTSEEHQLSQENGINNTSCDHGESSNTMDSITEDIPSPLRHRTVANSGAKINAKNSALTSEVKSSRQKAALDSDESNNQETFYPLIIDSRIFLAFLIYFFIYLFIYLKSCDNVYKTVKRYNFNF